MFTVLRVRENVASVKCIMCKQEVKVRYTVTYTFSRAFEMSVLQNLYVGKKSSLHEGNMFSISEFRSHVFKQETNPKNRKTRTKATQIPGSSFCVLFSLFQVLFGCIA